MEPFKMLRVTDVNILLGREGYDIINKLLLAAARRAIQDLLSCLGQGIVIAACPTF